MASGQSEEVSTAKFLSKMKSINNDSFLEDANNFIDRNFQVYLNKLLEQKQLSRKDVIKITDLGDTYGWMIFTGKRKPSRNKILQLCFAMQLSVVESNRLLRAGSMSELYPKNQRDAIIIFCLENGYSLSQADTKLYENSLETCFNDADK